MLLSEAEWFAAIEKISPLDGETVSAHTLEQISRAIEAAILAKLGAMDLPEPIKTYLKSKNGPAVSVYSADQLRQAYAQGAAAQLAERPVGYMRKWAFDGETPVKERKENGRMAWPYRFKLLPITEINALPDDLPLYTRREA
jgi:hypothetical protein